MRLLGMMVFTLLGALVGIDLSDALNLPPEATGLTFSLMGALAGLIMTPWLTTYPARSARRTIVQMPAETLVTSMVGLLLGIVAAALFAWPLSLLPRPLRAGFPRHRDRRFYLYQRRYFFPARQRYLRTVWRHESRKTGDLQPPHHDDHRRRNPARYQRDHRRAHPGHQPDGFYPGHAAGAAFCAARTPTRRGLCRYAAAQSRQTRVGYFERSPAAQPDARPHH